MKKILIILIFSNTIVLAEKQKCRELKIGPAYFKCLKNKIGFNKDSSGDSAKVVENDDRSWYQKIKDGKPLLSNN